MTTKAMTVKAMTLNANWSDQRSCVAVMRCCVRSLRPMAIVRRCRAMSFQAGETLRRWWLDALCMYNQTSHHIVESLHPCCRCGLAAATCACWCCFSDIANTMPVSMFPGGSGSCSFLFWFFRFLAAVAAAAAADAAAFSAAACAAAAAAAGSRGDFILVLRCLRHTGA